ncbi:unnamed protein product [Rotaria sordida]|uniref:F-box domain-containing protein n=1 Tax=Rotaria sordida TaxID=392033 RepID=A0A815DI96_9BILA|nr:unnamed protein product [Rotaria sordida]CAF1572558.1 unnamed protein product [Rotaria sordida]
MNLELLPNEMFLTLFEYFNGIDLFRAFYNLNYRFNNLLYKQFRFYCFKFQSISKRNFDMICQQHLPFIADRIITLHLSNSYDTPNQINLFRSYISSFNQFTRLQSLKLFHLNSHQTLLKILTECRYLNNLTDLNLHSCSFQNDQVVLQSIVDQIWSLPKLTNCYFDISIARQHSVCLPKIISSSLECITIFYHEFEINQINQLLEYTPRLKRLLGCYLTSINDNYIAYPLPTLIDLKISFYSGDISKLIIFLQNVPNLCHLDINIFTERIDGYQWEKIIRNYLPKLKTFKLKCRMTFIERNLKKQVDKLINSFRTSFWIDEHKWFFRCFTYRKLFIHFYTLSHPLDYHFERIDEKCKLTCPQEDYHQVFNNTTKIYDMKLFNQPIPSHIRFLNIKYLHIEFPINDKFWFIVPSLNRLRSLNVSSYADSYQLQLQTLLDRASHLETLTISQDGSLSVQLSLLKCTTTSVRRFHLGNYNHCFNKEQCITLSRSPLMVQCEVLSIEVDDPECIINLIKNMTHLRSLYVYWDDKKNSLRLFRTTNDVESYYRNSLSTDEVIQCLKVRLPSRCSIVKVLDYTNHIHIWI